MTIVQEIKLNSSQYSISGLSKLNVILGRNGCGKSTMLRAIDGADVNASFKNKIYLSPERSGTLFYQPHIDQQIRSNENYLLNERQKNQAINFKVQTAANFLKLQQRVLSKYHDSNGDNRFRMDPIVNSINGLLENIIFVREENDFYFISKSTNEKVLPEQISSGESELTAIAIEILNFCYFLNDQNGLILIDEPDVHIHPDLQAKLMDLIFECLEKFNVQVIISTHSTAILAAIANKNNAKVCFMKSGEKHLEFRLLDHSIRRLLPAFGAHPLTQIFNNDPPLILEGEDDERIWIQAIRSSQGSIRLFPVVADDKKKLSILERAANEILPSIFDDAKCFSLRDGDGISDNILDEGIVVRFRLNCYAAENLMLTDDVLIKFGLSWEIFKEYIDSWVKTNPVHPRLIEVKEFKEKGYDRKEYNLKNIRQILASFFDNQSPWEVKVGQTIASKFFEGRFPDSEFCLKEALGSRFISEVLGLKE